MVDRSVPIGPVWGVAAGSQADDGPGSVLVEDGSLAHAPKADPSRGHEGGVYQRPDERVKRATGRREWSRSLGQASSLVSARAAASSRKGLGSPSSGAAQGPPGARGPAPSSSPPPAVVCASAR